MSKDFSKRLGNKKLNSLIPTSAEDVAANQAKTTRQSQVEKKAPTKNIKEKKKTEKTTVATFRIKDDNLLQLKALAFWERKKIQDSINEAIEQYLDKTPPATLKKAKAEYEKRLK